MKRLAWLLTLLLSVPALAGLNRTVINAPVVDDGYVQVRVPSVSAYENATVTVPIHAMGLSEVYGIDLHIKFDFRVIEAFDVIPGDVTSGMVLVSNTAIPGYVYVALYGTEPTSGDGDLLSLRFHVVGNFGSSSEISIRMCSFDEGRLICAPVDGYVTVEK